LCVVANFGAQRLTRRNLAERGDLEERRDVRE
jgi:hypothetical protein